MPAYQARVGGLLGSVILTSFPRTNIVWSWDADRSELARLPELDNNFYVLHTGDLILSLTRFKERQRCKGWALYNAFC
jgi:hypothetical protein